MHIVSDVTENRQLEEQFREAQKFETVGTLAAGVAHDFNNLLTSIMGNASLVLGDLERRPSVPQPLAGCGRAPASARPILRASCWRIPARGVTSCRRLSFPRCCGAWAA